jgi:D-3-phosphoglycerate dehydrogenase
MKPKILITDTMHECIIPMLENAGYEVDYLPKINRQQILKELYHYIGVIVRSKTPADQEFILAGKNLKFIARSGAGMDLIDISFAEERKIALLNAPEGNRDAVAEHTVGMLLSLINKIHLANEEVKQKVWERERNRGIELKGRTFAIIGYGNMGEAVSLRLAGFGCKIIAYDKYKSGFGGNLVEEVSLEEVFDRADIVSFHVPLTTETRFYVNNEFFCNFRKEIILINTARGEILPLQALLDNLQSGKIVGACLDVLENEKMGALSREQDAVLHEMFEMKNVLFTPHIAGWTTESYIKISQALANKIIALNLV